MSESHGRLDGVAAALQGALEASDASAVAELLAPDVTWGFCAGRDDVEAFVAGAMAAPHVSSPIDVSIEVADDRLVVAIVIGDGVTAHQAMFVTDGQITEICDAAGADHAHRLRPIGSLSEAASRSTAMASVAPVLPVSDLTASIAHYRSLGFAVRAYDGDALYAFADRDGVALHLAQVHEIEPTANTSSVYLYVDDADALYSQWRLAAVAGTLRAPADTEYGLREGTHSDPDGNLLRFGSESQTPPAG
jgi:hypothetical protein